MDQVDDLTFRVNFGGDGVEKLRERVKDKLKEFMGDYTDDTLVVWFFRAYWNVLLYNFCHQINGTLDCFIVQFWFTVITLEWSIWGLKLIGVVWYSTHCTENVTSFCTNWNKHIAHD